MSKRVLLRNHNINFMSPHWILLAYNEDVIYSQGTDAETEVESIIGGTESEWATLLL